MNPLIRCGEASDIEALVALSHRTISTSYRSFLGDEAVDAFLGSGAVDQYVAKNIGRCWIIVGAGGILGYSVCRDNCIDLMMIDQPYHRQGLGARLLAHVEEMLFERYDELKLESFAGNANANGFYCKHGWREVNQYFDQSARASKIIFRKTDIAHDRPHGDTAPGSP